MIALVIPDIHQRALKVDRILNLHGDECDRIIFLGDYWDSWDPEVGVEEMTRYIIEWKKRFGSKCTFLMGNHDLAYAEDFFRWKRSHDSRGWTGGISYVMYEKNHFCSGWTKSKSLKIAKTFVNAGEFHFFDEIQLCTWEQGFLLSHAGFHWSKFMPMTSVEDNIQRYIDMFNRAKECKFRHDHMAEINAVGRARGGRYRHGGPLWLDWNEEFEPIPSLRQIVGHTATFSRGPRHNDGNWCIDDLNTHVYKIQDEEVSYEPANPL